MPRTSLLVALFLAVPSVFAQTQAPAAAKAEPPTAPIPDDPFLWLEAVEDDKALSWVRERNGESTKELVGADFEAFRARFLAILESETKIPYVSKIGPHYYNLWRDAKNPRGLWRRTTLEEYAKAEPAWETVLDVDALGATEGVSWVWGGAEVLEPEAKRCLVQLSRGGADASVVREFDLETKAFVPDGFTLPEAKSSISWRDRDSVWVGTDFGPGALTSSGYPRITKLWKRGTPLTEALTRYEGQPDDVWVAAGRELTPGFERDYLLRGLTFFTSELYFLRGEQWVKLAKPDDANAGTHREWLFVELRTDWTVGERTYAAGSLLATRFEAFLAGGRDFDVLFEPSERVSLSGYSATRNHVILSTLDNVRSRITVLTPGESGWTRKALEGLPEFGEIGAGAVDPDESDDYFATVNDFLTPPSLYHGTLGGGPPKKLKSTPAYFDAQGLEVEQHEAVSADGTRIPYFEVKRKGLTLDGTAPTLLYAYGGFEVSMTPSYGAVRGAGWLERGGVYVLANIRGGGEFGPRWHQAALKANRPRAYADLAAVARDLAARKVTSAAHLGVMGGSNGGLLVGNMITRYPELFRAAVCQVPLLDMRRYHLLLAGASWMGEYGDPDVPAEWEFIRGFSPYHLVTAETKAPRTLFLTSTRDDRVHPGHARKMVARMRELGQDVLYYENIEGGHGGAADTKQEAFMSALAYTFLWNELQKSE